MNRRSIFKKALAGLAVLATPAIKPVATYRAMGFDPGYNACRSVYAIWSVTDDGVCCRQVPKEEFEAFFKSTVMTPKPINNAWIKAWEEGNV